MHVFVYFRATVAPSTQEKQQIPLMDYVLNVVSSSGNIERGVNGVKLKSIFLETNVT